MGDKLWDYEYQLLAISLHVSTDIYDAFSHSYL